MFCENYQECTSVLKSSPFPGLATDTHTHKHCEPEPQKVTTIKVDSVACLLSFLLLPGQCLFPCSPLMHNTMQCPVALLPLHPSVSTPSQGLCDVYSCISILPKDIGLYSMPFCLPSLFLLCPSSTPSLVAAH